MPKGLRTIVFGTSNANKLAEFEEIIRATGLPLAVVSLASLSLADAKLAGDAPEIGESFGEIAAGKAAYIARRTGQIVVAEDSGLVVDPLGGWPGIHSKRVAGSDEERVALLLAKLGDAPDDARGARFVCAAAVADERGVLFAAEGEVEGRIIREPRGANGFGYDPVFFYPPAGKTFAEMSRAEKSQVSHRRKALEKAARWFAGFGGRE